MIADLTQVTDMPTSHSILASSCNSTFIGSNKTDKENMIISHLNKKTEKSIYIKIFFSLMILFIGFCISFFGFYEVFFNLYYFLRKTI